MRKNLLLAFFMLGCCNVFAQTTSINCSPDVTIGNTPSVCTGTTTLKGPGINFLYSPVNFGNALNMDGASDYVSINTGSKSVSGSYTVEAWIKPSSTVSYNTFFSTRTNGNYFNVKLMNGNQIACVFGNTSGAWITTDAVAPFSYSVNTWYHIAVAVTPATYTIYVNGLQVGNGVLANGTPMLFNTNGIITIGAVMNNATENFQGAVDEVRVWNVARTPAEILANLKVELNAQAGLVAAYHFNEGVAAGNNTGISTTADASGNNLNGTLTNFLGNGLSSNWVDGLVFGGIKGNALSFDGTNDYVSLGTSALLNITNSITIEAWVKVNSFTKQWQAIVTKGDNSWRIHRYLSTNQVAFGTNGLSNVDLAGTKNINDGQWHHIAGVYNGATKFIYIDGVLDASIAATGNITVSSNTAFIGENEGATGRQFNGSIDEVRIWNIARTAAEIQSNMHHELFAETGLVALYHLNQGTSSGSNTGITSATDASGNNITGTLNNFVLTGTASNWVGGQIFGVRMTNNAPATYPSGISIVTWTATEGNGNTSTCNQTVTVVSISPTGTQVLAQNNVVIADGDASPSTTDLTDFGDVAINGFSISRNFSIKNPSAYPLIVSAISVTGASTADFKLENITLPITIAANGQITFSFTFTPLTIGAKTATINIASNNCEIASYDFVVKGNGILAQAQTFDASGNFVVPPNVTSISVRAWGAGGATASNSLDGGGGGAFVQSTSISVTPGSSIAITIGNGSSSTASDHNTIFGNYFTAKGANGLSAGTASTGSYIETSYDGGGGRNGLNYNGLTAGGGGGGGGGSNGPGGLGAFGNNGVGGSGGIGGDAGTNGGSAGGNGGNGKSGAGQGTQGNAPGGGGGGANARGANGRVIVSYCLLNVFTMLGNNTVIANLDNTPSADDNTDFGELNGEANLSKSNTYTLKNEGLDGVKINSITLSNGDAAILQISGITLPLTVAAGASASFKVRFAPISTGNYTGTINIATNNCNIDKIYSFSIKGAACLASQPAVYSDNILIASGDNTPLPSDFGEVAATGSDTVLAKKYTIKNPGTRVVNLSGISISGTNAYLFGINNSITFPIAINPGDSTVFYVFFIPKSLGQKTATVNIATDNCLLGNKYNFDVKGLGVADSSRTEIYTSAGNSNFVVPTGVSNLTVQAWGSGSGGASDYRGAGGGGAYVKSSLIPVVAKQIFDIKIGAGGKADSEGGKSSFGTGAVDSITAYGGTIGANGGGLMSSGKYVAQSYRGGGGGSFYNNNIGYTVYGGGGAGASATGTGAKGQDYQVVDNSLIPGIGAVGIGGGGTGGNGGIRFSSSAPNGTNGSLIGAGGGGYGGAGADGRVIVAWTCPVGTIGNSHTIPYPAQRLPDFITNISAIEPTAVNGLIYKWEYKTDLQTSWTIINTPNITSLRIDTLPFLNKASTYSFRRSSNICDGLSYSNVVTIKVVTPLTGAISGTIRSKNGTAVQGITVYAQKTSSLAGSPATFKDSAVTGSDGQYTIRNIYFGDENEAPNTGTITTAFRVTPFKANHYFKDSSITKQLSNTIPQITTVDFTDTTVLSITGKIYQECIGCLNSSNLSSTITGTVDSVEMYRDGTYLTKSGFLDPPAEFGRYALSVTDPGTYKIEPKYKNHQFLPLFKNILVDENVQNIDFKDTSTHTISGYLFDGCSKFIGQATLEFYDILPNDADNHPRSSQFRKRVTINAVSGFYSISLPARKYAVKLIQNTFSPANGSDVSETDLLDFFDTKIPKDSLARDITSANATLNLVYMRAPVIEITGLDTVCNNTGSAFAIVAQGLNRTFTVKVYQGAASKFCRVADTTLQIFTNIQNEDNIDTLNLKTSNGQVAVTLKGGTPNIIAPYKKELYISFTDIYGRTITANPSVVVTGVKTNVGSFTTVTPELPLMVLHDPPGDNSYSSWKTGNTNETVTKFYTSNANNVDIWGEVKLGAAVTISAGAIVSVGYDAAVWGKVGLGIDVGSYKNKGGESVVTTTTSETFSTSNNATVIGAKGDVFIGAAMNLLYSKGIEISYNADSCNLFRKELLVIAPNGFATQYIYSEDHIRNQLIPNLTSIKDLTPDDAGKRYYADQIKIWQQTLDNNDYNKKTAAFDRNWSFDGAAGPYINTTTSAASKSNTIEFTTSLDINLATELGFEIAGSGYKGGVETKWKMETGKSTTNNALKSTTFEYQLDDGDNGDFYSVDVKKDPVYNSPVFELKAGVSSCPFEPGTQPRDEIQLIAEQPSLSGIASDGVAEFKLRLGNTSQSGEKRTYNFSFLPGSNPDGANVEVFGSPASATPAPYTIDYLAEKIITVRVKHPASSTIFSYEGLQFIATDSCSGTISKTAKIAAFFDGSCGKITLISPSNNWVTNGLANNTLGVSFKDYNLANVTSIELQYAKSGTDSWITGFTRAANQLSSNANGTSVNWNIGSLADGAYNLRLKLICPSGIVYSERVTGIIDRIAPIVFGKAEPTDDNLVAGDQISISYNEALDVNNIDSNNVKLYRLSNKQQLSANIVGYANQLIIVPNSSILNYVNDSFRVVIQNITDLHGNVKSTADSFRFVVGKSILDSSGRAINLSVSNNIIANNAGARAQARNASAQKNGMTNEATLGVGDTTIAVYFDLKNNAVNETRINFNIGGSAVYNQDYTIRFDSVGASFVNRFDGTTGSLMIAKGTKRAIVRIDPIYNPAQANSKTVVISALEGGDYGLGNATSATVYILNTLKSGIFEFTGSGNFSTSGNWLNSNKPGYNLPAGSEILINPISGGECILDVPLTIMLGAKLTIAPNKNLRIIGNLDIKK